MELTLQSVIGLHSCHIRSDKKNYIFESLESGDFFEMPEICVDAIRAIQQGQTLDQIETQLRTKYSAEDVDMIGFAEQLLALGLIRAIDGQDVQPLMEKKQETNGFLWISEKLGKLMFSPFMICIYIIFFGANLLMLMIRTELLPRYSDIFVFQSMTFNVVLWLIVSLIVLLWHELGHIAAMRSYGLPTRLSVGHRLFFVVLETDMSFVWRLEPKQRNVLYLAGIAFDHIVLFAALSGQLLFPNASELVRGILEIAVLDIAVKLVYQCCIYMKTDLYFVFENITGCYNVMENGKQRLSKWIPFLRQNLESTAVFAGEERVIRWYAWLYLAGLVMTVVIFCFYFMPQTVAAVFRVIPHLTDPVNDPLFWDAAVFLLQFVLFPGLLMYSWLQKR